MFGLGLAEIILTATGVLLLYLTLKESRSASNRQIAIAGAQTDIQPLKKKLHGSST
jgi:hypothetical protein